MLPRNPKAAALTKIKMSKSAKKRKIQGHTGCIHSAATRKLISEVRNKSPKNKGILHYRWHGGRKQHSGGYVLIYSPKHPFRDIDRYVLEHRLVMEKMLGRYLKPEEVVHHVNGIKDDNRKENLKLFLNQSKHISYHQKRRK